MSKTMSMLTILLLSMNSFLLSQSWEMFDLNQYPQLDPSSFAKDFIIYQDKLYFNAYDGGNGKELWVSDGTQQGTILLKDIKPGSASSDPNTFIAFNGLLFFVANSGTTSGDELWVTDGTEAGTQLFMDINPGSSNSNPGSFMAYNNWLYFGANDGVNGYELWRSDGTVAGTSLFKDIISGSGSGFSGGEYVVLNDKLIFNGKGSSTGVEPWITDGTVSGTVMLKDIYTGFNGSNPSFFCPVGDTVAYFVAAHSSSSNYELFRTDGTNAGTYLVKEIFPSLSNGSNACNLIYYEGQVFFRARDGVNGGEIWVTDGTTDGTTLFLDLNPGSSSSWPGYSDQHDQDFFLFNGELYFSASNAGSNDELWKTDGTPEGTVLVKEINQGTGGSTAVYFTEYANRLFFKAYDATNKFQLWSTDGSETGTLCHMPDSLDGYSPLNNTPGFMVFDDALWFQAIYLLTASNELWKYQQGGNDLYEISGHISYANATSTPYSSASLALLDEGGDTLSTTLSDVTGYFAFSNLSPGNYQLLATNPPDWNTGGVNATDALAVLKHFTGIETLQNLQLQAADVNLDLVVNATDALLIMKRFVGIINAFTCPDWLFEYPEVTLGPSATNTEIRFIKAGDTDASYMP